MQVSFHGEVEDHVVIGGGVAQACGIEDTAEFLDMLSDTIYREKALAAVREPICNAWDAHIATGKTDIPLVITLGDGKLTIQDFGPGIAPDKMHGIYCVYGRSTKKTDETQTGGFGIGSKAPWAYSKHFTVTSAYNGTRTIYAMSKGSVENNGKPDMRPITSVPCDQSGLSVTIPIQEGDERKFEKLIWSVVVGGGIRAVFNGELLPYRDYDAGRKQGFVLVEANDNFVGGRVAVLVGTVLYPLITENEEIYQKLRSMEIFIPEGFRVVLLAEPNTISIAPSRENLSYGDRTLQAVSALLDKSLAVLERLGADAANKRRIIQAGLTVKNGELKFTMPELYQLLSNDAWDKNVLFDPASISMLLSREAIRREVGNWHIRGKDLVRYALEHLRRTDRSRADLWKDYLLHGLSMLHLNDLSDEIYQHTVNRIAKKAAQLGLTKEISLFHRSSFRRLDIRYSSDRNGRVLFDRFLEIDDKPVMVMACRAGTTRDWIAEKTATVYSVSRTAIPTLIVSKGRKDEARLLGKFMESLGFAVTDLLDQEPEKKVRTAKVEKPKKGLFFAADRSLFDAPDAVKPYEGVPKHFIYISQRRANVDNAWRATYDICIKIANIVPDTCVIFGTEDLKEAEAQGMTSAVRLALDLVDKAIHEDSQAVFDCLRRERKVVSENATSFIKNESIIGLNKLIRSFPVVFSVIQGRRSTHVVSEMDQNIGALMSEMFRVYISHDAYFRGRYKDESERVNALGGEVRHSLHNSKIRLDGSKLINKFPNLTLLKFREIEGEMKSIPESAVVNIIRAIMKA